MTKYKKLFFGLTILISSLALTGGGCMDFSDISTDDIFEVETFTSEGINDSTVAMSLLQYDDVYTLMNRARPSLPELNDHLDDSLSNYDYVVARAWFDRDTGNSVLQNAITQYPTPEIATSESANKGEVFEQLSSSLTLGDSQSVYYLPADEQYSAEVVYRFTMGRFGIKVSVSPADTTAVSDKELQDQLLPIAETLARKQADRFGSFLAQERITLPKNAAVDTLPSALTGTQAIGALPFSEEEWLGVINDLDGEVIGGFQSGALSRFSITSRPNEIAEVSIIELDTEANAKYLQEGLLATTKGEGITELTLPDSIAAQSDGISDVTIVETQSFKDNYFVDIVIFSPFAEMNITAAEEDVVKYTEEVLASLK